jgi:hypothetical protein
MTQLTLDYFAQRSHILIDELIRLQPLPGPDSSRRTRRAPPFSSGYPMGELRFVTGTTLYLTVDGTTFPVSGSHGLTSVAGEKY